VRLAGNRGDGEILGRLVLFAETKWRSLLSLVQLMPGLVSWGTPDPAACRWPRRRCLSSTACA